MPGGLASPSSSRGWSAPSSAAFGWTERKRTSKANIEKGKYVSSSSSTGGVVLWEKEDKRTCRAGDKNQTLFVTKLRKKKTKRWADNLKAYHFFRATSKQPNECCFFGPFSPLLTDTVKKGQESRGREMGEDMWQSNVRFEPGLTARSRMECGRPLNALC